MPRFLPRGNFRGGAGRGRVENFRGRGGPGQPFPPGPGRGGAGRASLIESLLKVYYRQGSSEMVRGKIPPVFPNEWIRSCLSVDTNSGLITWVAEGTHVLTTKSEEVKQEHSRNLSKRVILGARSWAGNWAALSQSVTNLNIYSSSKSIEKMKSMTEGEICAEEGDYLAWRDMEWILHGQAFIETVDVNVPCKGDPYVDLYYTPFPRWNACMHHCQNIGSRAPSVTSFQDWTLLQQYVRINLYDRKLDTLRLWLPVEDYQKEGQWRDFYTEKVIQNYTPPWVGSRPDGGEVQNCAYLRGSNVWGDFNCDHPNFACMCLHNEDTYLHLRGLCPTSLLDVYYKQTSDISDARNVSFQGLRGTLIRYDEDKLAWTMHVQHSNATGVSGASRASFTLGKHNWTIIGDSGCNEGKPYNTELKMSGCQKGNFTCNDGQCVSMELRCNQLPDCRDKSDEKNCNILVLEDGYNMEIPPINSSDPVKVMVSIDLLRIVGVNEEDYSIDLQFEISLMWKEKRATFQNLKDRDSLDTLSKKDIAQLWLPKVIYENTDQKKTTRVGTDWEWETRIVVRREQKNGRIAGYELLDETEVFGGFENSLVMNQTYTHTFQCNYQLSSYPFDTQVKALIQASQCL